MQISVVKAGDCQVQEKGELCFLLMHQFEYHWVIWFHNLQTCSPFLAISLDGPADYDCSHYKAVNSGILLDIPAVMVVPVTPSVSSTYCGVIIRVIPSGNNSVSADVNLSPTSHESVSGWSEQNLYVCRAQLTIASGKLQWKFLLFEYLSFQAP